jgi:dipeptidase
MKSLRLISIGIFILFLISNAQAEESSYNPYNCFSVIVGKGASLDGSVLLAHNEDNYTHFLVDYHRVPRKKHKLGTTIRLSTGAIIPQVAETYSYVWVEMPMLYFSDTVFNEWGVTISSNRCASKEENPVLTQGGIKHRLRLLMAERAKTAREAVLVAGKLIDQLGYASSGRTYVIADTEEGWMLSVVNGKRWIAQRVPDDKVAVIPNYYTIGNINLKDKANFLGSQDIIEYAIKQGWYNPEQDGPFHFAKAYSKYASRNSLSNVMRMWRGVKLLAHESLGISNEYDTDFMFPFAFPPSKKLGIKDLLTVLRDHYQGTKYDNTQEYLIGDPHKVNGFPICAIGNNLSYVAQLRNDLPTEIGAVLWLSQQRPDVQAYVPWYSGIEEIPNGLSSGNHEKSLAQHIPVPGKTYSHLLYKLSQKYPKHAYLFFSKLSQQLANNFTSQFQQIRKKMHDFENQLIANQSEFERQAINLYKKNPNQALKLLTGYSADSTEKVIEMTKTFLDQN